MILECVFNVFLFSFWGVQAFRHPFVPFRNHFSIIFIKNNVLPAWELMFQPDLSSHASKTAIFDFKKQGFHLPVFFTFCNRYVFLLFFRYFAFVRHWAHLCNQSAGKNTSIILSKEARCFGVFWFFKGPPPFGLIYATKAPNKILDNSV